MKQRDKQNLALQKTLDGIKWAILISFFSSLTFAYIKHIPMTIVSGISLIYFYYLKNKVLDKIKGEDNK